MVSFIPRRADNSNSLKIKSKKALGKQALKKNGVGEIPSINLFSVHELAG